MTDALDKARQDDESVTVRAMTDDKLREILASMAASTAWKHKLPLAAEFFREVNRRLFDRSELDTAKQRIAELTAERDAFKDLMQTANDLRVHAEQEALNAHRAGFEAAKKAAVEIARSQIDPDWPNDDVSAQARIIAQAISQLKPEGV